MAEPSVEVWTDAAAVAVRYTQAPALVAKNVVQIFRRIGSELQKAVLREKLNGRAGGALDRRTGTLARAIYYKITIDGGDAVLVLGADKQKAAYAAAQEYGATIVPVRGKFLAIPIGPALTANGVARVSAKEFISNPGSLGFEGSFVNKAKTAIMGVKGTGADAQVEPVFALKTSVHIPERSYLRSTVRGRRDWILEQLGTSSADTINQALDT